VGHLICLVKALKSRYTVGITAPTDLSVDFWALVRGFFGPKIWAHGHIADGGYVGKSLEAHNGRSVAYTSGGASGL
jgi:hypothetical protein